MAFLQKLRRQSRADADAATAFDVTFPLKEERWQSSQEEFYSYSHSVIVCG